MDERQTAVQAKDRIRVGGGTIDSEWTAEAGWVFGGGAVLGWSFGNNGGGGDGKLYDTDKGSYMANVFELLMQLLQIRSDNRQMVLRECLEPLKRELDCIHLEYLNNFHRYRASVLKDDVTGALVRELNHDLDLIMARRSQLSQMLLGLMGVSHNRLDRHKKYLQTFVETVFEYLTLQKRGTDDDVLFQMEVKQLIGRHNPTYEPLQLNVVGGAKVIQVIDIVLDHFKIKYRRIGETYADFRTFLLK